MTRSFESFVATAMAQGFTGVVRDISPPARARVSGAHRLRILTVVAREAMTRRDDGRYVWHISARMVRWMHWLVPRLAARGPVALVSQGGELGVSLLAMPPGGRRRAVRSLAAAQAIFVQTATTEQEVRRAGLGDTVRVMGGLRRPPLTPRADVDDPERRPLRLVYAGRLTDGKGIDELFDLAALAPDRLSIELLGPVVTSYRAVLDRRLVRATNVVHLGELPHRAVSQHLRDADFSILLSRFANEGVPGSVIESLAVGTPAIVSEWRGLEELVRDGVDGLVVPPSGDSWDLTGLLDRLLGLTRSDLVRLRAAASDSDQLHDPVEQVGAVLRSVGVALPG